MAEITARVSWTVLILALMTFGDAGVREIPSGQETVRSHTQTGGQNTSPGGEAPCGESPRRREIPGRRRKGKKSVSRRPVCKGSRGKKKKRRKPGSGSLKKSVEREKKKKETAREKN